MGEEKDWYSQDAATFGDRVAGAREAAGLDQPDLARRLGVKLRTLRNWEEDLSEPRANKLQMMAGVLNVSLIWLLTGEGEGIGAVDPDHALSADLNNLLEEFRDVRRQLDTATERLGQLEKKLRANLTEAANGNG